MTPDEAAKVIRATAGQLSSGEVGSSEMWSVFSSNLGDLCRDEPLSGDFLALFRSLEAWELAEGTDLPGAVDSMKDVARRLASEVGPDGPTG
jgi:hypothetical protein